MLMLLKLEPLIIPTCLIAGAILQPMEAVAKDRDAEAEARLVADERAQPAERVERERIAIEEEIERHQDALHQLRMREIDIRAAMETARIEGEQNRAQRAQHELVQTQRELEHMQVELEQLMTERERQRERREIMRMTDRLEYIAGWREVAFDPPQAVVMATQAVVELRLTEGGVEDATQHLDGLLSRVADRGTRTAIRFALKDLYLEQGRTDAAVSQMLAVIEENASAMSADAR